MRAEASALGHRARRSNEETVLMQDRYSFLRNGRPTYALRHGDAVQQMREVEDGRSDQQSGETIGGSAGKVSDFR